MTSSLRQFENKTSWPLFRINLTLWRTGSWSVHGAALLLSVFLSSIALVTPASAFEPNWIRIWSQQNDDATARRSEILTEQSGQVTNHRTSDEGVSLILADLKRIQEASPQDQKDASNWIIANQLRLPPPYLFEAARQQWATDQQRATDLHYIAFIRSRYDASKCLDRSASQGLAFFAMAMPDVPRGLQGEEGLLRNALQTLDAKEDLFEHQASAWWICSHGMRNIIAATSNNSIERDEWRKPEVEWPGLRQGQRDSIGRSLAKLSTDAPER